MPENRLSLTVIESISADGKAIPPVAIVPGETIMESWFHENMTGHEVVTVSPSGYINEEICNGWLGHFIKHNDCGPDKPWRILLMDGATCHDAPEFILRAKMNRIWIVKFPSHQTHLIQPLDVGCFRSWKIFQQKCIMNAIRSHEAEYNVQSFFRDLPKIRERTFTVRTIKHSFQNAGKHLGRQEEAGGTREEEEKGHWLGVLRIWVRVKASGRGRGRKRVLVWV